MVTWIVLGALALIALIAIVFVVVPSITLRAIAKSLKPRIAAAVPRDAILLEDLRANSLGLTSMGKMQARGNGGLVLTKSALVFFQVLPRRDVSIPLDRIIEVKTVRSHLGKTYFRDLLFVSFRTETGTDSVAWYVADLPTWLASLSAALPGKVLTAQ